MGFTRYWTFDSLNEEKFKYFSSICETLIDNMDIPLDDIAVSNTQVRFNGVDDDAHETFNFKMEVGSCARNRAGISGPHRLYLFGS